MTKKIFIIGLVLAAVLSMSGCMPGSEQWNIRIAAHCYIKGGGLTSKAVDCKRAKNWFLSMVSSASACVNGKGKCVSMWQSSTLSARRTETLISVSFTY